MAEGRGSLQHWEEREEREGEGEEKKVSLLREFSRQLSLEEGDPVTMELEFLQNVYFEELEVKESSCSRVQADLLFHITPSTGHEIDKKYIYLDLHILLSEKYPQIPAEVTVSQSRGISDARLREILSTLSSTADNLCGGPMVFELVELAKDSLTDNNLPCGDCVICLLPFQEKDSVARTECYHYFHVGCLAQHLHFTRQQHAQQQLEEAARGPSHSQATPTTESLTLDCPVCREAISTSSPCFQAISQATPTQGWGSGKRGKEKIHISKEIRYWQREMAGLLQRQREKGGLIDVTAKDQTIDETWVRPVTAQTSHKPGDVESQNQGCECSSAGAGTGGDGIQERQEEVGCRRQPRRRPGRHRGGGGRGGVGGRGRGRGMGNSQSWTGKRESKAHSQTSTTE